MRTHPFLIAGVLLSTIASNAGDVKPGSPIDAKAAFSKLKTLAGEWKSDSSSSQDRLSYRVIAGGTALVERDTADRRPEMLTV